MIIKIFENNNENEQVLWTLTVFENAEDFEMENGVLTVWDSEGEKHSFTNCRYSVDYNLDERG